jgi:two-component system nitrate/nitrite response regulator NarL
MLGGDTDLAHLSDAYSAGADGYLLKNISSEALITSCRLAMLGEKVFPRVVLQFLQSALSSNGTCDDHPASVGDIELSDRELAVIRSLASGHTNKIIASNLNITEATVKVNLKGILRKLGATNRTQVAIWALQNKLASNETHSYVRSPAARSDAKDLQLQ